MQHHDRWSEDVSANRLIDGKYSTAFRDSLCYSHDCNNGAVGGGEGGRNLKFENLTSSPYVKLLLRIETEQYRKYVNNDFLLLYKYNTMQTNWMITCTTATHKTSHTFSQCCTIPTSISLRFQSSTITHIIKIRLGPCTRPRPCVCVAASLRRAGCVV